MKDCKPVIVRSIYRMLRPVVRILLRNGIPFKEFSEIAKQAYVDIAFHEFGLTKKKQTNARVAILTGLTRKEVLRLRRLPEPVEALAAQDYNRAARVISGWVNDAEFVDASGEPLRLPIEGSAGSFDALVKRYSGDMPPRAMMDELVRVGTVEFDEDERLVLMSKGYVPKHGEREKLAILGVSASDLLNTIDHNLVAPDDAYFQLSVAYDNLPPSVVEAFRRLSSDEAMALLQKLDRFLNAHDRDTRPAGEPERPDDRGRLRAGMGIYYFESAEKGGD